MLGYPQLIKAALFERHREVRRRHRIISEENRSADFHSPSFPGGGVASFGRLAGDPSRAPARLAACQIPSSTPQLIPTTMTATTRGHQGRGFVDRDAGGFADQ